MHRAREPFDPGKIHNFFNQEWPGVVRAKGFLDSKHGQICWGRVSQAGAFVRHQGLEDGGHPYPRQGGKKKELILKR